MADSTERLTDAVIDLLVSDGFEGVTVRRVAQAAGVSIGAVQHHFPTKAAMLEGAMKRISEDFTARLNERLAADDDAARLLRVVSDALLGIGEDQHRAGVIWLQRAARAAVDPEVAKGHAEDWLRVEDLLAELLRHCRPDRDQDWHRERAARLLALLDGLAVAGLTEPRRIPADRARRILEAELNDLLSDG